MTINAMPTAEELFAALTLVEKTEELLERRAFSFGLKNLDVTITLGAGGVNIRGETYNQYTFVGVLQRRNRSWFNCTTLAKFDEIVLDAVKARKEKGK